MTTEMQDIEKAPMIQKDTYVQTSVSCIILCRYIVTNHYGLLLLLQLSSLVLPVLLQLLNKVYNTVIVNTSFEVENFHNLHVVFTHHSGENFL